ncbi:MAG: hypothetical protein ACLQT6_08925 [Desulfomonilaceae bacterium]
MKAPGFLIIGLILVFAFTGLQDVRANEADEAFKAGKKYLSKTLLKGDKGVINRELEIGFRYKADLFKFKEMLTHNDTKAMEMFVERGLRLNNIGFFKKGVGVYCIDTDNSLGLVKVRGKGDIHEYWMLPASITKIE